MTLRFDDESEATGDLLVGADGRSLEERLAPLLARLDRMPRPVSTSTTIYGKADAMLNIRDEKTDRLVREYAQRRSITMTQAIREAVAEALAHLKSRKPLLERTAHLRARFAKLPPTDKSPSIL